MSSLLLRLIFLAVVLCVTLAAEEKDNGQDRLWSPDWGWYPRSNPRRPPPPVRPTVNEATDLDHKQTKTEMKEEKKQYRAQTTRQPPKMTKPRINETTDLDHKRTKTEEKEETLRKKFDLNPTFRNPWPRRPAVLVTKSTTPPTPAVTLNWRNPWPRHPAVRVTTTTTVAPSPTVVLYKYDCDPCMPGWGVKSMCNATSNTVCKPCSLGTWSPLRPHFRPCQPCTKCGPGQFEEVTCVGTRDTTCNSCSNPKARITDDFMKKCWTTLVGTMNPRELEELDDARLEVEVVELKSKEFLDLARVDASPEFGSNEEDFDSLLLAPPAPRRQGNEDDVTVDDPEIDSDLQDGKKDDDDDDDVSKDEEEEWARVMALRDEANDEIAQISRRLPTARQQAQQGDDSLDMDDDDDAEPGPRRLLLHPIRPLPQMVPVPEKTLGVDPEDDIVLPKEPPVENNFPPSYHNYNIDSLARAGIAQRRKAIVLLVLTCAVILSTFGFIACYVRDYCRRRETSYNRVLVVNLSPEEREIVRQSADALERMEKPAKKYRNDNGYSSIHDDEPDTCIYVTENPLEEYLNATDDRLVAREGLIDNEVLNSPRVHRHTSDA